MDFLSRIGTVIGRVGMAALFICLGTSHILHWDASLNTLMERQLPHPEFYLIVATLVQILAGVSLAIGFFPRTSALLLAFYLIPFTIYMHPFWCTTSQIPQQELLLQFLKNFAIFGGLLAYAASPLPKTANKKTNGK